MDSGLIFPHRRNLNRMNAGWEKSHRLKVVVPQGDVEASAKADSLNSRPRKAPVYTKAPVP